MTLRSFTFVLVAISLLIVGSLAVACGGADETLTFEEYFARFDELGDQFEAGLQEAGTDVPTDNEDDALSVIRENLVSPVALYAIFVRGVSELKPPDGITSEHEELEEAMRAFGDVLTEYSGEISNVASMEELQALASNEALEAAGTRAEEACLALQQIAANAGIELDLNCGSGA